VSVAVLEIKTKQMLFFSRGTSFRLRPLLESAQKQHAFPSTQKLAITTWYDK